MSRFDSPLSELLWELSMISGQDEDIGSTDELGWFALFRGPLTVDDIDDHNDIVLSQERQMEEGYREHLLNARDIIEATTAAGFILKQHDGGAICSTVYQRGADLEAAWGKILAGYTVNVCSTCDAESEEFGVDAPIIHETDCLEAAA